MRNLKRMEKATSEDLALPSRALPPFQIFSFLISNHFFKLALENTEMGMFTKTELADFEGFGDGLLPGLKCGLDIKIDKCLILVANLNFCTAGFADFFCENTPFFGKV